MLALALAPPLLPLLLLQAEAHALRTQEARGFRPGRRLGPAGPSGAGGGGSSAWAAAQAAAAADENGGRSWSSPASPCCVGGASVGVAAAEVAKCAVHPPGFRWKWSAAAAAADRLRREPEP